MVLGYQKSSVRPKFAPIIPEPIPRVHAFSSGMSVRTVPNASLQEMIKTCQFYEHKCSGRFDTNSLGGRYVIQLSREIQLQASHLLAEIMAAEHTRSRAEELYASWCEVFGKPSRRAEGGDAPSNQTEEEDGKFSNPAQLRHELNRRNSHIRDLKVALQQARLKTEGVSEDVRHQVAASLRQSGVQHRVDVKELQRAHAEEVEALRRRADDAQQQLRACTDQRQQEQRVWEQERQELLCRSQEACAAAAAEAQRSAARLVESEKVSRQTLWAAEGRAAEVEEGLRSGAAQQLQALQAAQDQRLLSQEASAARELRRVETAACSRLEREKCRLKELYAQREAERQRYLEENIYLRRKTQDLEGVTKYLQEALRKSSK